MSFVSNVGNIARGARNAINGFYTGVAPGVADQAQEWNDDGRRWVKESITPHIWSIPVEGLDYFGPYEVTRAIPTYVKELKYPGGAEVMNIGERGERYQTVDVSSSWKQPTIEFGTHLDALTDDVGFPENYLSNITCRISRKNYTMNGGADVVGHDSSIDLAYQVTDASCTGLLDRFLPVYSAGGLFKGHVYNPKNLQGIGRAVTRWPSALDKATDDLVSGDDVSILWPFYGTIYKPVVLTTLSKIPIALCSFALEDVPNALNGAKIRWSPVNDNVREARYLSFYNPSVVSHGHDFGIDLFWKFNGREMLDSDGKPMKDINNKPRHTLYSLPEDATRILSLFDITTSYDRKTGTEEYIPGYKFEFVSNSGTARVDLKSVLSEAPNFNGSAWFAVTGGEKNIEPYPGSTLQAEQEDRTGKGTPEEIILGSLGKRPFGFTTLNGGVKAKIWKFGLALETSDEIMTGHIARHTLSPSISVLDGAVTVKYEKVENPIQYWDTSDCPNPRPHERLDRYELALKPNNWEWLWSRVYEGKNDRGVRFLPDFYFRYQRTHVLGSYSRDRIFSVGMNIPLNLFRPINKGDKQ